MSNIPPNPDAEPGEMRSHPDNPDRRDLERLLDGHPIGSAALDGLLAAARSTGGPADHAGLGDALASFTELRTTRSMAIPASERSPFKRAARRIASARMIIVAAVAVLATGGIAVAATTGSIPNPLPNSPHTSVVTPETTSGEASSRRTSVPSTTPDQTATSSQGATSTSTATDASSGAKTSASASSAFLGLCRSWLARPHDNGNADDSTAFDGLIAAAGGVDSVDSFCAQVLASPSTSTTASAPASTTTPANSPTPTTPTASSAKNAKPTQANSHSSK